MTSEDYVFISYARQDGLAFAERLDNELQARGKATWRDKRNLDPNQDFTAELEKAIEAASHVVVCITPDTKRDNSFVRREIGYALAFNKRIIPLTFADVVPPIHIVNLTRIEFHRQAWTLALADLLLRLDQPATVYEQATPPHDPFRDYLNQLYQEIVNYLDATVFTLIPLHSESVPGEVIEKQVPALLQSFVDGTLTVKAQKPAEPEPKRGFSSFPEAFEAYDGRLLLLGEPGAGKTTTLMAYARDAVARRLEDPSQPLPLERRITEWDTERELSFAEWLSESVGVNKKEVVRQAIENGQALLLLDGLDELTDTRSEKKEIRKSENSEAEAEDEATKRENPRQTFIRHIPPNNRVLITCRVRDYAKIEKKVALNGALRLEPLDDTQILGYLQADPDLVQAVISDEGLREMARTPLLLSLLTYAYRQMNVETAQLRDLRRSPSELRRKVFEMYIQGRYQHEQGKPNAHLPYDFETMCQVLGQVAKEDALSLRGENQITSDQIRKALTVLAPASSGRFPLKIGANSRTPTIDPEHFIKQVVQLHILVPVGNNWRFIHLLLRDYFAVDQLLAVFKSRNIISIVKGGSRERRERYDAAKALGKLGDVRAVDTLIAILQNDQIITTVATYLGDALDVREAAAIALGELGDTRAVEPLIAVLNNKIFVASNNTLVSHSPHSTSINAAAAEALGKLGDARAVEPLIAVLQDKLFTGMSLLEAGYDVRRSAAEALGKLGDARAVEPLIAALKINKAVTNLSDGIQNVRRSAAEALGRLGDKRAVEPLIEALLDDQFVNVFSGQGQNVRRSALKALVLLGDVRAVEPLIAVLSDKRSINRLNRGTQWVREEAAEALGNFGDPRAVKALSDVLDDKNVGRYAEEALSKIDTPEAKAALNKRQRKST
jgi:HEAT repeat protein/DNA polymerase III delta prime subunit